MNTNKLTLKLYWRQVRQHKVSFFIMLFFVPASALIIDTLLPYFLSQAIGSMAERDTTSVTKFLWIAASIGAVGAIANYIGFKAMVGHESDVTSKLRQSTFSDLINKDLGFFANQKVGAMTSRFIDFIRAEVQLQDLLIIRTMGFVLSLVVGLTLIGRESLLAAGVIFGLLILLCIQIKWSTKKRAPYRHERKTLIGEIHGSVADTLTNNLIVKTFAGEKKEISALRNQTDRYRKVYRKDFYFRTTEGSIRVALTVAIQVVAIIIITTLSAEGALPIATAIFLLAYLQRLSSQIFVLGDIINGFDQGFLDAGPMSEMINTKDQVTDKPGAISPRITDSTIVFDNASYHYNDSDDDVLKNISLTIPKGQKVGLVGHSGAGKSTITHLLLRFADVTAGSISIGGHDIRDITQQSLRESISYVPQEPLLFHRTLKENIAYGKPDATDKQITAAAKQANALEFIGKLPKGFDTLVGERGIKLSGGQRQRIAIARALLKDAPILVLDEATSALDSESEKLIQDALEHLMKGRTSIVIAHRLSTIAKLDRIIVLSDGSIIEDGTHAELVKKRGTYAGLWAHQSGGFIEE